MSFGERPAHRVLDEAGPVLVRLDLPELLDADAVFLVVAARVEAEAVDELLRQAAARALGEDRVLGAQLHAAGEVGARLAVAADAHVAGRDADDPAHPRTSTSAAAKPG